MSVRHGLLLQEVCVPVLHSADGRADGGGGLEMSSKHDPGCFRWEWAAAEIALATFPRMKRSQTNLGGGRGAVAICLLLSRAQVKGAEPGSLLFTWIILVNGWRGVPEGSLVSVGVKDSWPNVCVPNTLKKRLLLFSFFHPGVLAFAKITCFRGLHRNWTVLRMLKNTISLITSFLLSFICPCQCFVGWQQKV